jgi:hypothetical protein
MVFGTVLNCWQTTLLSVEAAIPFLPAFTGLSMEGT